MAGEQGTTAWTSVERKPFPVAGALGARAMQLDMVSRKGPCRVQAGPVWEVSTGVPGTLPGNVPRRL